MYVHILVSCINCNHCGCLNFLYFIVNGILLSKFIIYIYVYTINVICMVKWSECCIYIVSFI